MQALTYRQRETGAPQLFAWRNSLEHLTAGLREGLPEVQDCGLVLEYEIPLSGGRRPDLIFLNNGTVLVIEFKNRVLPEAADIDQVLGYARELADYHGDCREKELLPVLVPLGYTGITREERGIRICSPGGLAAIIRAAAKHPRATPPDTARWVQAPYEPQPALVEAARLLFERQPLPRIRTADGEDIPGRVAAMESVISSALEKRKRTLILFTGAPGSGKTLVGLQLTHSRHLEASPVMLSGNRPLVAVLQHVLKSDKFVMNLKNYLRELLVIRKETTPHAVLIFDEAQRAWDRDRVLSRHQGDLMDSEPALILSLGKRAPKGFAVVALMGEGQEIHAGEESGIANWVEAVRGAGQWDVVGPPQFASAFISAGVEYRTEPKFHLTTSLRSRRAGRLTQWVELLLSGQLEAAAPIGREAIQARFPLWVTRDMERAKAYVRDRYEGFKEKRVGVLASSKFRKLEPYGIAPVRHDYYYYGEWYEAPADHNRSGSRLETAISEFGCQGLELDLPLLMWGPDLRWENHAWTVHIGRARVVKDPARLRFNAYRVLLTRGRDGLVVFVPPVPILDGTADALLKAGMEPLPG